MDRPDDWAEVSVKCVQNGDYIRSRGAIRIKLEKTLSQKYEVPGKPSPTSWIFSSGMNAIASVLNALTFDVLTNKVHKMIFVSGDELYCDTPRVLKFLSAAVQGSEYVQVRISDTEKLLATFKQHGAAIRIFFFECCSNPAGQTLDFSILPQLAKLAPNCRFIADNTWLSAEIFNPFKFDHVDVVVESLTKYYSGGRCIAGFAVGKPNVMDLVTSYARMTGVHVDPKQCQEVLIGMGDMTQRIERSHVLTQNIAEWLEKQPTVNRVMYPLLKSHPSNQIYLQHVGPKGPSCLWFHVCINKKSMVQNWVERHPGEVIFETSFGDGHSKIDPWPTERNSSFYDVAPGGKATGKKGTWVRLSVGHYAEQTKLQDHLTTLLKELPSEEEKKPAASGGPKGGGQNPGRGGGGPKGGQPVGGRGRGGPKK